MAIGLLCSFLLSDRGITGRAVAQEADDDDKVVERVLGRAEG